MAVAGALHDVMWRKAEVSETRILMPCICMAQGSTGNTGREGVNLVYEFLCMERYQERRKHGEETLNRRYLGCPESNGMIRTCGESRLSMNLYVRSQLELSPITPASIGISPTRRLPLPIKSPNWILSDCLQGLHRKSDIEIRFSPAAPTRHNPSASPHTPAPESSHPGTRPTRANDRKLPAPRTKSEINLRFPIGSNNTPG